MGPRAPVHDAAEAQCTRQSQTDRARRAAGARDGQPRRTAGRRSAQRQLQPDRRRDFQILRRRPRRRAGADRQSAQRNHRQRTRAAARAQPVGGGRPRQSQPGYPALFAARRCRGGHRDRRDLLADPRRGRTAPRTARAAGRKRPCRAARGGGRGADRRTR